MAKTLEELLAEYRQTHSYTPLTQAQMQQQAATRYDSIYDQRKQSANQAFQTADLAYANQLSGLQGTYDKQRESTAKNFEQAYSTADRQSLRRGMQRSSYNNATLANIDIAGQEAQQDIDDAQAEQTNAINRQRTLASEQLAKQIAQYNVQQQADEQAYIDQLIAREYERSVAADEQAYDLAMAVYNAQKQQEALEYQKTQDTLAQQNWLTQFEHQKSQDTVAQQNWQAQLEYQKAQDALEQQNWLSQFEHQKAQDALAQENWLKEYELALQKMNSGGVSYSGSYNPNRNNPITDDDFNNALDESAAKVPTYDNETDVRVLANPTKTKVSPTRRTVSVSKY